MRRFLLPLASTLVLLSTSTADSASAQDEQIVAQPAYVTRAEAMMIILSSTGTPVPDRENNGLFPDLPEKEWYTKYMLEGAKKRMITPNKNGYLVPLDPITRVEFLKMMSIAFELEQNMSFVYTDIEKDAWYIPYIGTAYKLNLFESATTQVLKPHVLMDHFEASLAIQSVIRAYPDIRKTTLRQYTFADEEEEEEEPVEEIEVEVGEEQEKEVAHESSPVIEAVDKVIDVVSSPPQEQIKFITTKVVKDAMVRLFQKNAVVSASTKQLVINSVNIERQKAGLPPLQENPLLNAAAAKHAEDMWKRKYFAHTTPDGVTYVQRIRNTNYLTAAKDQCRCVRYLNCTCSPVFAVGENIAQGQFTVSQVMSDWMNSPAHRKNILSPEFDEIGIGLFGTNWVQNFGHVEFFELPGV